MVALHLNAVKGCTVTANLQFEVPALHRRLQGMAEAQVSSEAALHGLQVRQFARAVDKFEVIDTGTRARRRRKGVVIVERC